MAFRNSIKTLLALTCGAALLTGCASAPSMQANLADRPEICPQLFTAELGDAPGLPADSIQLVNWNIEKGLNLDWNKELASLSAQSNLVLLQESMPQAYMQPVISDDWHYSFAKGYRDGSLDTGVMTASTVAPLAECHFTDKEPWLRTPKATNFTAYGLQGTDETLMVVNIHAVNFALGLQEYNQQLWRIHDVLHRHQGPIILSGDFNTWRERRMESLEKLAGELDLVRVRFPADQRTQVLGNIIDHVYVRGFEITGSHSFAVDTSDHNPMQVSLRHNGVEISETATAAVSQPTTSSDALPGL